MVGVGEVAGGLARFEDAGQSDTVAAQLSANRSDGTDCRAD